MKFLLLFFSLLLTLQAESLESLVEKAYANDPTLKMLHEEAALAEEEVGLSDIWENPMLKLGLGDIRLDDPADRSLEPMQTQFVAVSQKIPLSDKFALAREIAQTKAHRTALKAEVRKRQILSKISKRLYVMAIIDRRLKLLAQNRVNLQQIRRLFKGYQASEDLVLEAGQSLLLLKTKEAMLQSKKAALRAEIEGYTLHELSSVDIPLIPQPHEAFYDKAHPLLRLYQEDIAIAKKKIALAKAKERPDITVGAGYYQRVDREDYLSVSVAIPLQIREKEKLLTQKAKVLLSYQKARLAEIENRFASKVKVTGIEMRRHRQNYRLYQKRIIPLQKRISWYLKAKNRSGALDLSRLVASYNRVISLEERALDELSGYFTNYATLRYYQ